MSGVSTPYYLLKEEIIQRADEGCRIPASLRERFDHLDPEQDEWDPAKIDPIYGELMALPCDEALARAEPNDLEAIRALRPEGPVVSSAGLESGDLLEKLHGAWLGRCLGCVLGKPFEMTGLGRDDDGSINGRRRIREYLEARGDWPLRDFVSNRDVGDGWTLNMKGSMREDIACMPGDDDLHYTLMATGVLEAHGAEFDWTDVARFWACHIPVAGLCTSEGQAFYNAQQVSRVCRSFHRGPDWIRRHRNPYREWIGAQIRADGWAYACAGDPERAAEFAWRDAHWTHERNGIYGEMMLAAMIAAAFVESDLDRLIDIGLSQIPRDCRLARWVGRCREWMDQNQDWEGCMEMLEAELRDMHVVHTINNLLVCLIALKYGNLDPERTPAIAVMCGLDTDCNGASTGSIVGALHGARAFRGGLADRLNDRICPSILGFNEVGIREMAERSLGLWISFHDDADKAVCAKSAVPEVVS